MNFNKYPNFEAFLITFVFVALTWTAFFLGVLIGRW